MTFRQNFKMSKHSKKTVPRSGNSLQLPDIAVKSLGQGGQSKLKASNSENNLKTSQPLKPSLSTKSWSVNQKYGREKNDDSNEENLAHLQELNITELDDFTCSSNLLRAKDSLENLLKTERLLGNEELRFDSPTTSSSPDSMSPRSLPALNESTKATVASKSLAWESSEKTTRNRKTKDKKKKGNKTADLNSKSQPFDNRDFRSGDEKKIIAIPSPLESCYVPYEPKPSRSVVFTNEVMVVYFNGEHVVCESKEPLKKELEQQVRNKEMRKGHIFLN
ncbi:hypothetical protein WA026_008642 [Henosepilachna vigintioctopunctata]|uniref:Uncharacterized protein n=1 Tax=Henosepilachna vigintioctopunctata TaxID=420089 RepID=A0AAW1UJ36_9CUCU